MTATRKSSRRDTPGAGTYDKVVSCEMIEAVGHEHLVRYFDTINAMLKPGGRAAIQVPHNSMTPQATQQSIADAAKVHGPIDSMKHLALRTYARSSGRTFARTCA